MRQPLNAAEFLHPIVQGGYFTDVQRAVLIHPNAVRGVGKLPRGRAILTPAGQ